MQLQQAFLTIMLQDAMIASFRLQAGEMCPDCGGPMDEGGTCPTCGSGASSEDGEEDVSEEDGETGDDGEIEE